jgi:hypothetical protein
MNDQASTLPARDIAISLMRNALLLLDHAGDHDIAAALQHAIDIAEE